MTTPTTLQDLINNARTEADSDEIANLQCAVMALAHWLYKTAGCPHGDDHDGLARWVGERFEEYECVCGGE